MSRESIRRAVVFVVLLGAFLGGVVWLAGGVTPAKDPATDGQGSTAPPRDDAERHDAPSDGRSVGRGRGGRLDQDEEKIVAGKRVRYRAWTVIWGEAEELSDSTPDTRRLRAQDVTLLLFREPDAQRPEAPPAREGPGVTRLDAPKADIVQSRGGRSLAVDLRGGVEVSRILEPPEGSDATTAPDRLTLRSPTLRVELDKATEGPERRTVQTPDPVRVSGNGADIRGTGLRGSGDLGRLQLERDVVAVFERNDAGDAADAPSVMRVTCRGQAVLEAQDRAGPGQGPETSNRWRASFDDDVRAEQRDSVMTCDRLAVEWRRAPEFEALDRVYRFDAVGNFDLETRPEQGVLKITSDSARRYEDDKGADILDLDGSVRAVFEGVLGLNPAEDPRAAPAPSTVTIISRTATLKSRPNPKRPGTQQAAVTFRDDVVAVVTDSATGEVTGRMEAPVVHLYGDRFEDGRFDPETLTAEGGTRMRHLEFDSESHSATWTATRKDGSQRILLSGGPSVRFRGRAGLNFLGRGARDPEAPPGEILLTCQDTVEVVTGPRAQGGPPAPVEATATLNAVVRKIVGETEPLRLSADQSVHVRFDGSRELESLNAYGNARVSGRDEDGSGRRGEAEGARIMVRRTPGEHGSPWSGETVVMGQQDVPGRALLEDADGTRHELRGGEIRYSDAGSVLTATRNAHASAFVAAGRRDSKAGSLFEDGRIELVADRIVATSRDVPATGAEGRAGQELSTLEADGGVRLWGSSHELTGQKVRFDARTGLAQAEGTPARITYRKRAAADGPQHESYVTSPVIRTWFEVSDSRAGEFVKATCAGGQILGYILPQQPPGGAVPDLERVLLDAAGPIELTGRSASAREKVRVLYQSVGTGGRWTTDATLYCDEAEIQFDPAAGGAWEDRITQLVATSRTLDPVRLSTPELSARADRVVIHGSRHALVLSARPGRKVEVEPTDDRPRFRCDSCTIDYRTYDWSDVVRFETY